MKNARIGIINWDACLPPNTYFGGYASASLSDVRFRNRVPFYADATEDVITFHKRTQEEFDLELIFAEKAGIDYFAYCYYRGAPMTDDSQTETADNGTERHLHELNEARKLHSASALRERVKMCFIFANHTFDDEDYAFACREMQKPYYEKIDGRPLVYFFGGYNGARISKLSRFADKAGLKPFIAFIDNGPADDERRPLSDAVSFYGISKSGITEFGELADYALEEIEKRKRYGKQIIPTLTLGWDPRPRILHPVPWYGYPDKSYAPRPTEKELTDYARKTKEWINANASFTETGHVLVFAWNEFEEGGWLCPPTGADGKPDLTDIIAFRKAADILKD